MKINTILLGYVNYFLYLCRIIIDMEQIRKINKKTFILYENYWVDVLSLPKAIWKK